MPSRRGRVDSGFRERKEVLSVFRELWSMGNSPLHRMYSSWEELERNIDVKSGRGRARVRLCPYCGAKQAVTKPLNGIFPYADCFSCKRPFYVEHDFSVRRLTDDELAETPEAWIRIVDDLTKKKTAVVLRLE